MFKTFHFLFVLNYHYMFSEQQPPRYGDLMYLQAKDSNGTEVKMKILLAPSFSKPPQFSKKVGSLNFKVIS